MTHKTYKNRKPARGGTRSRSRSRSPVSECPICMEELNSPSKEIKLHCNHRFHKECMRQTCNAAPVKCKCPMCRRILTPKEYIELDISPTRNPIQSFPSIHGTRYLNTIDDFKTEINRQLRAPTRTPMVKLTQALSAYLGTDFLPLDIYDDVMEFEIKDIRDTRLQKYQFVRMVRRPPIVRRNRKYFKYEMNEDETIGEDSDYTVIATDVYEV